MTRQAKLPVFSTPKDIKDNGQYFSGQFIPNDRNGIGLLSCDTENRCVQIPLTIIDSVHVFSRATRYNRNIPLPSSAHDTEINLFSAFTFEGKNSDAQKIQFTVRNLHVTVEQGPDDLHPSFEHETITPATLADYDALPLYPPDTCYFYAVSHKQHNRPACQAMREIDLPYPADILNIDPATLNWYRRMTENMAAVGDNTSLNGLILDRAPVLVWRHQIEAAKTLLTLTRISTPPQSRYDYFTKMLIGALNANTQSGEAATASADAAEALLEQLTYAETEQHALHTLRTAAVLLAIFRFDSGENEKAVRALDNCFDALTSLGGTIKYQCHQSMLKNSKIARLSPVQRELIVEHASSRFCANGRSWHCLDLYRN